MLNRADATTIRSSRVRCAIRGDAQCENRNDVSPALAVMAELYVDDRAVGHAATRLGMRSSGAGKSPVASSTPAFSAS